MTDSSSEFPVPDYAATSSLPPTHLLTAEQVTFFHEHGYASVDAVMPTDEIEIVREIYDHLFVDDTGRQQDLGGTQRVGEKAALPQILQPSKFAPALLRTQLVANLKAMMKQLQGETTVMVGDHAINKPPHNQAATPWHQDEAYWNPAREYRSLSAWVALQPATLVNGCMNFVPGSHRLEVIPHRPIGDNPLTPGLEVVPGTYDFSAAVACELPAGGATFHDGRTLHYTAPNNSDDFRRAYIAMGSAYERPREEPRRFPWQERQRAARATAAQT
ncbi:phytanoyl-CoA dioxygenase family protein [Synoicihabitans lomoniglobus]|uniref:Phytanoyl-CoA dioxygenase family protein n=1 Tax=Synoicihabitans lomoniglobus TaxID=2909285 RepID=A0AAE9ZXX8_9BACT|nr:phytanoyl-CoA dioxygenase family protein [Opitutaceae bacterium LMO-M01]WED65364.1 phytanoyl-CoA dioxygenase family protein [Opitutaceae bacterium LMO-M01]